MIQQGLQASEHREDFTSAELSKVRKSIRTIGGLNIAMGVVSIVTGLVVGVGCIVSGGRLLNK